VLFSVTSGGGTISPTTPVTTGASGVASLDSWVINVGSNTVQAVGTYADPTVTFAPSSVTGFPQAVTVAPTAGITFSAIGGDVIPYGSSYGYSTGDQGFDPTFGTHDYTTTLTASGPFGTGDLNGTVCAINSDANFVPNKKWPLGTDLLLLKTFPLPTGWNTPLTVTAAIDNDIAVFVNGHSLTTNNDAPLYQFVGSDATNYAFDASTGLVTHDGCANKGSLLFTIPVAYLHAGGQNTIAVRARDRGVVNYVDLKVSAQAPATP
jgi:hypothetical protein